MSVKVDLDRLADELANYTSAYLVTVGDDYHAHAVAVDPVLADGVIDVGPVGRGTRRNAESHSGVTLVWPPTERGGYTLIVDGQVRLGDDSLAVVPNRAVLHRKAQGGVVTKADCNDAQPASSHGRARGVDRGAARQADPRPPARPRRMTRVAPLAPPWSAEDAEGIGSWGHPDRTYEPLLLVRCLQRHPKLAAKLRKLGEALYIDTRLPPRARTLAILRICALVGCAYEWGGQAAFWGPIAGVSEAECDALVTGADAGFDPAECTLIAAVDEIERTGSWSTATWNALGDNLDDEQRMELLIAVGWYRTICTLCNGLDLPVEGWMRPWPGSAP